MSLQDFKVTIREFLRYGYSGFIAFLVCALIWPKSVEFLRSLGNGWTPVAILLLGVGIYAFHRAVGNYLILDPLAQRVHRTMAPMYGYDRNAKTGYTCVRHMLEESFSVSESNSLNAYRIIRDSPLFEERLREQYHMHNSEIHTLHVTFTVLTAALLILILQQFFLGWDRLLPTALLFFSDMAVLVAGILASIDVCRQQCAHLLTLDPTSVRNLLVKARFTKESQNLDEAQGLGK